METGQRHARVVVIWRRFGEYHLARLKGASEALREIGLEVVGLEIAGRDEYAWAHAFDPSVWRLTLFPDESYARLRPGTIRRAVARSLAASDPVAVCVNGWAAPEAVAALRWCRGNRRRVVLMSETFGSSANPLKMAVRRWRVRQCDAALVSGRPHAAYLGRMGYQRRVELGYAAVDNAHFSRPCSKGPFNGAPPKRYFFANTRFLERKSVDVLLRAYGTYRQMHERHREAGDLWHLVISGSGEMERPWKQLAASLGLTPTVHWPGFLQYDQLPSAYQSAGAFVHTARREAWGLVVNEAAAAGLPLLVSRYVGAASELVREGENGFLMDPDCVEACAGCLFEIARLSDDQRAAMGAISARLVAAFGPARFGQGLRRCLTPCEFRASA